MFTVEMLRDLFRYTAWADATVWRAIYATGSVFADEALREKVRHLHRTQQFFMKVWRGDEISYDKVEIAFEDELSLVRAFHDEAAKRLDALSERELSTELVVPWAAYYAQRVGRPSAGPTTRGETMFQVVSHSTYHRGQINTRIRESGGEPPLVDYIAWLWLGRPDPEWPALSEK